MAVHFKVPAVPVAQPRQRHRVIHGKDGRSFAHNYTPTKDPVNAFKASVQQACQQLWPDNQGPIIGAVRLSLLFVLPRPACMVWKTKPMPRYWHDGGRSDLDNYAKAVMDALKSLAWKDDRQVVDMRLLKVVAAADEQPHVEVLIEEMVDFGPPQAGRPAFHALIPFLKESVS